MFQNAWDFFEKLEKILEAWSGKILQLWRLVNRMQLGEPTS